MNRIRQGWDALRRGRRSGVSLVIALCAVAVLIGLSLSIVYSSSMLLSRANRKIGRERCYQLAQSFAQVLDSELTAYNTERRDLGGADDKWPQTADGSRTFYQYANSVLENLDAYDADDPEHTTYYYSAGDEDDDYGKVTVMLRKQNTDSEQNPGGPGPAVSPMRKRTGRPPRSRRRPSSAISFRSASGWKRARTASPTRPSITAGTAFSRSTPGRARAAASRRCTGSARISAGATASRTGSSPKTDENGQTENVFISYRYDPGYTTYKKYEPVNKPAGGARRMKKLIQVLRDRRGESMVEILVSTVVFMLLLGALNGAVGFASNAQRKAEQLREDAVVLQREVRAGNARRRRRRGLCFQGGDPGRHGD